MEFPFIDVTIVATQPAGDFPWTGNDFANWGILA
jgi:hypothetical protein